jgi:hypothetical protein
MPRIVKVKMKSDKMTANELILNRVLCMVVKK